MDLRSLVNILVGMTLFLALIIALIAVFSQ